LLTEPQMLYIFRIKKLTLPVYIWVTYFWATLAEKTYMSCVAFYWLQFVRYSIYSKHEVKVMHNSNHL